MEINNKFQLKEPVIHGNDIFPINVYNNIKVNNKQLFLYHWHNEVEFLHLREGEATFYLDTNPIVLKKGEFIFINSGIVHSGYSKNYLDCSFDAIVFDTNILNSNTTGISQNKYISPFLNKKSIIPNKYTKETDWGIEVIKSLNFIIKEFNSRKKGYELAVNGALYMIFYTLISYDKLICKKTAKFETHKLNQFKKILLFIKKNYYKKLNLAALATEVNMSSYHFCRFFKAMSGKTPFEYLINYRIYISEKLLLNSDKKILSIAMEAGFNNIGYFIKSFKKYKNCTPSEFRDKFR